MQQVSNNQLKASSGWPKVCYGVDQHGSGAVVVRAEKKHGKVYWEKVALNNTTLAKAVGDQSVTSACLSARDSLTRMLEAPFSSRKKALRVLPTLLDIQLPFSIEDCQYEFYDHRKTAAGTMEALAVAVTKENILKKISNIKEAGFDPEVIDVEGLAVWSLILHEEIPATSGEKLKVALVLNGELSSLTIGRGQRFLNSYGLRANDVKRALRLVKAHQLERNEVVSWSLAGEGAADADLMAHWKQELSVHSSPNVSVVEEPESFLARALAIRALSNDISHCNLRSGDIIHSRIAGHNTGLQLKFALLLLFTGIMLCAGNILMQRDISGRQTAVNKKVKASVDSLAGYHVTAMGADAMAIVDNSIATRKADLKPFLQAFSPSLLTVVADVADAAKNNNLRYNSLSLTHENVSVNGNSAEFDASQEVAKILVRAGYLVSNKRGSAIADERIPFTITTEQE